jgi:hypothetical protein
VHLYVSFSRIAPSCCGRICNVHRMFSSSLCGFIGPGRPPELTSKKAKPEERSFMTSGIYTQNLRVHMHVKFIEGVGNHMQTRYEKTPFKISTTSEICQVCFLAKHLRNSTMEPRSHPMVGPHEPSPPCQSIMVTDEMQQREIEACVGYNRLPGTRINRQQSAASTTAIHARHIRARLLRSFLSSKVSAYPVASVQRCLHTSRTALSLLKNS